MIVYKFTKEDGKAPWGNGYIPLPKDGEPGAWIEADGELQLCRNGIHGFPSVLAMLNEGLFSDALWIAELEGEILGKGNAKVCARRGRLLYRVEGWHGRNVQLWLCDCAERTLPIYEAWASTENQPDENLRTAPRRLIEATRKGESAGGLVNLVAWAAWAARAAWAAWAAWAAENAGAAENAWAAGNAEREWQAVRLHEYLTGRRGEPKP